MHALWDDAPDVLCVHPLGPTLLGYAAVMESWTAILSNPSEVMAFAPERVAQVLDEHLAVHHVHEHIRYGEDLADRSTVIAINIYRRTASGWRMIAHHGAPVRVPLPQATVAAPDSVH